MKTIINLFAITLIFLTFTSFHKPTYGPDDFRILIDKSDYELTVFDADNKWIISYPVVFGNKDQGDKMYEGDRKTPEGIFHISMKRPHEKWSRFMLLDYPTEDSYRKFNERKAQGLIPKGKGIGFAVGIHGTWPNEDIAIDMYDNWTDGCISTKNDFMVKLYDLIPVGTMVLIQP